MEIHKVIDPTIGAAYFLCKKCGAIVMTTKETVKAEYSSAFARFKNKHRKCL